VLPPLARIYRDKGIELRGDAEARRIVPDMKPATEED
jgi:glutamate-5-semialdehyde dehydrogenase